MVSLSSTLEESEGVSGATLTLGPVLLPHPTVISHSPNTYGSEHADVPQVLYIVPPESDSGSTIVSQSKPVCEVCLEAPDLLSPTPRCAHDPMICAPCLGEYTVHAIKVEGLTRLGCPAVQCREELGYEEVIGYIGEDVECLDRYKVLRARRELERNPNFMWCPNPKCGQGQVHTPKGPIVTCDYCNTQACFLHRVPWHEGLTCEEYTIDREALANEANGEYFKTHTKRCPSQVCGLPIEKDSGCDHMTCFCGYQFCWDCLADYMATLQQGSHLHNSGCRYYTAIPRTRRQRTAITRIPRVAINQVQRAVINPIRRTVDAQVRRYRAARTHNYNTRARVSPCACGCRPVTPRARGNAIVKRLTASLVRLVSAMPRFPSRAA